MGFGNLTNSCFLLNLRCNANEFKLTAGTGVTLTRGGANNNELTFAVAQDLSASATPTFAGLNVTGSLTASSYSGDASQLSSLTGATSANSNFEISSTSRRLQLFFV